MLKQLYQNFYNFIWSCMSMHCTRLSEQDTHTNTNLQTDLQSVKRSGRCSRCSRWLDEIAFVVESKFEQSKTKYCFISLFRTYFSSLQLLQSTNRELKLSSANVLYRTTDRKILLGRWILLLFLFASTTLGLVITGILQIEHFSFTSSLIAVLCYISVAGCVYKARALPLFKLSLVLLIALTSFNTFFWNIWQQISNTDSDIANCYSEICILLMPESLLQTDIILKVSVLIFWFSFLILLSSKNPVTHYLTYQASQNRKL